MSEQTKEQMREEAVIEFIKEYVTTQENIDSYRDHIKDFKRAMVEEGKLTKKDITMAIRAYNLIKNEIDVNELDLFYEKIREKLGLNV